MTRSSVSPTAPRRVLVLAQEEARLLGHSFIGTEHILLGLIHEHEGVAAQVLAQLEVSLEDVRSKVEETIGLSGTAPTGSPPFTPRAKKVMELSLREALQLGHNYIGTEHLLLGIVREGEGVAAQVLVGLGADLATVRQEVMKVLAKSVEHVGKEWTARVVRAGRTPTDYAAAYADLGELFAARGIELDDIEPRQLVVISVDTDEGPGLTISFSYTEDEPDRDFDDEDGDGTS